MNTENPTQHFQAEFEADKSPIGFVSDAVLLNWFKDSYSTSKHLLNLYSTVRGLEAKHVLEVGFGRSSIVLARAAAENSGRFICCDQRNFAYAFNSDEKKTTTFVHGLSSEGRAYFKETGIDFAFLDYFSDASIPIEFVISEIISTFGLLKKNGIIAVHDALVDQYSIKIALENLKTGWFGFHNHDLEILTLPFNYGLALIRRKTESPYGTLEDVQLKKVEV